MEGADGVLSRTLYESHSKGHEAKITGGYGARAHHGGMCFFRRVDVPDPRFGERWRRRDIAGDEAGYWSGEKTAETAINGRSECVLGSGREQLRPSCYGLQLGRNQEASARGSGELTGRFQ